VAAGPTHLGRALGRARGRAGEQAASLLLATAMADRWGSATSPSPSWDAVLLTWRRGQGARLGLRTGSAGVEGCRAARRGPWPSARVVAGRARAAVLFVGLPAWASVPGWSGRGRRAGAHRPAVRPGSCGCPAESSSLAVHTCQAPRGAVTGTAPAMAELAAAALSPRDWTDCAARDISDRGAPPPPDTPNQG